jgi:hypothetical protein
MYAAVRRTISDERILAILRDIIYSDGGGQNLPIGNLCSQWMGNLYMHELDIYIKNHMRVRHYIRYCDDFCIFSNDKSELADLRDNIRGFLDDRLRLAFSKSEIFPISSGLDFLGYRHFPDFILLRKRTAKKIMKRMRRITCGTDRARGQVASANGWMKFACSYNLRKKMHFAGLKNMVGIK